MLKCHRLTGESRYMDMADRICVYLTDQAPDIAVETSPEDIEYERRNGYSWYGSQPERLIRRYNEWAEKVLGRYMLYDEE